MNLETKSYVFGILITDGNMYISKENNKGKVRLELNIKDKDLIEKLKQVIPYYSSITYRQRDTNFKDNYESVILTISRLEFRKELIEFGYPLENKTDNASTPVKSYSEKDFWRGVIDGDGSLGFIQDGSPFLSLVTKSEKLKEAYCNFLKKNFGIIKNINRNARDNIYNITIKNEDAQLVSKFLYENSNLFLDRKFNKYQEIQKWIRTKKKVVRREWTEEEIEFIKTHSLAESVEKLGRTKSSIQNKKFRVTKQ